MIHMLDTQEIEDMNLMPAGEIDRQVALGNWYPMVICHGLIIGFENDETLAVPAAGESVTRKYYSPLV